MAKPRFVYWAHAYNGGPSHIFNRKRDAIEWGKFNHDSLLVQSSRHLDGAFDVALL